MALDIELAKAWCAEARTLLASTTKPKRGPAVGVSIVRAREKADEMLKMIFDDDGNPIEDGKPMGADESEWKEILEIGRSVRNIEVSKHQQKKKTPSPLQGENKKTINNFIAKMFELTANALNNQLAQNIKLVEEKIMSSPDPDGVEWADIRNTLEQMKGEVSDKLKKGKNGEEGGLAQSDVVAAANLQEPANNVIEQIKARLNVKKKELLAEIEKRNLTVVPDGALSDHVKKLKILEESITKKLASENLTSQLVKESDNLKKELETLHEETAARNEKQAGLRRDLSENDAASLDALNDDAKVEFAELLSTHPDTAKSALAETTRLKDARATTGKGLKALGIYAPPPDGVRDLLIKFDTAIRALKLDEAGELVRKLEGFLKWAETEKSAVLALQKDYAGDPPTSEEDWRKLNQIEQKFKEIEKTWPERLQARRAENPERHKVNDPLEQRCAKLDKNMAAMFKAWPNQRVDIKLKNSGNGSVSYMFEKLVQLDTETGVSAEEQQRRREQREWDAFCDDVQKHYDLYSNSNFDKRLRGADSTRVTDFIRSECQADKRFTIGGRTYTVSSSDSAGVSLKTPVSPTAPNDYNAKGEKIQSFIYHL